MRIKDLIGFVLGFLIEWGQMHITYRVVSGSRYFRKVKSLIFVFIFLRLFITFFILAVAACFSIRLLIFTAGGMIFFIAVYVLRLYKKTQDKKEGTGNGHSY